jgi:RNA polymerase sigma-70 factor (ECF subfamily)
VARLLASFAPRAPRGTTFGIEYFNGAPGIVARLDGVTITAMAMSVADGRVQSLQLVANPHKLVFLTDAHPELW